MSIIQESISNTEAELVEDDDYLSIASESSSATNGKTLKKVYDEFETNKSERLDDGKNNEKEFITPSSSDDDLQTTNAEQYNFQSQANDSSASRTLYISNELELQESNSNTEENHPISSEYDQSIENVPHSRSSIKQRIKNQSTPKSSVDILHGTTPISQLPDHGYELHHIKLIQPTETVPLGFKLSKQTDSLQCVISGIDQQSQADLAGVQVDDWLIGIEDKDIRSTEFSDVSQYIHQKLNSNGSIHILIARKKSLAPSSVTTDDQRLSSITTYDRPKETDILLSVGLSNKIEEKLVNQHENETFNTSDETVRHIILKDALGLDFHSFAPDENSLFKIHAISNVRPLSLADRAGLRNGDRILTVNGIDVTNTNHKTVRHRLLKKSPVHLTVVNDPNYFELIETVKNKQNRISLSRQTSTCEAIEEKSPSLISEDLINVLFIDDQGPVYFKHCVVEKEATQQTLGFALHHVDNLHIISDADKHMSAYKCGVRNDDVILYINKENVEQMTHDDVKILIRMFTISNEIFHLILLQKNDVKRYRDYQEKSFIDWTNILGDIYEDNLEQQRPYANIQTNPLSTSSSLPSGTRICILKPSIGQPAGFSISGEDKPPFIISRMDKDSPAERAGLQINDILLSINGKSLIQVSYDDTIQIIKEALQQPIIQILVSQSVRSKTPESSHSSSEESEDVSPPSADSKAGQVHYRNTNPLQIYQTQRIRELAYTLRLCHLNATNLDGTPASTFGFDITKESKYEYPVISRIEARSSGERSGLQSRDLLLKVNGRKTKGVDIDKVRRIIEKAKSDNRLEVLVVDEEVYRYCTSTHRKFKEPYIKVKHIFPKNRSSINFESLDSIAARAPAASQDIVDQLANGTEFKIHRLSITKDQLIENDDDETTNRSERNDTLTKDLSKRTSKDESMVDSVLKTFHHYFRNMDTDKLLKLDYDIPSQQPIDSQTRKLLPLTVHFDRNLSEEMSHISRLYQTACSNRSSGLYDYIRDPRRCVLQIDRTKGLGFILSATGDYDHIITAIEKNSIADLAGLQVNDELIEINGIDVRNVKYEEVIQMLFKAIQTQDTIEMCVNNNHTNEFDSTTKEIIHNDNTLNMIETTIQDTSVLSDDLSHKINSIHSLRSQTINTNQSNLYDNTKCFNNMIDRGRSGSIPTLSTGITASPKDFRSKSISSISSKNTMDQISKKDAPIARLCRIRKFPSSPFYGFFLCGNPKRLGRVYVSNIKKNSSAAVCGLRNGDRIIEVNGINIQSLTYETILNKIKLHLEHRDLELLVLDKKSLRWYRARNYPVSSQTLPTIVHIEPMINNVNIGVQELGTNRKINSFIEPHEATTSL
ncbi:hypothetical protein I4U23_026578 [Adineta vaga]|nr:hypothetical protein I4U23_026578 [Adineta vaga]